MSGSVPGSDRGEEVRPITAGSRWVLPLLMAERLI
jgi:hypothetical protein